MEIGQWLRCYGYFPEKTPGGCIDVGIMYHFNISLYILNAQSRVVKGWLHAVCPFSWPWVRNRVTLQTDGQVRTGRDVVIAAMLGAEAFDGMCLKKCCIHRSHSWTPWKIRKRYYFSQKIHHIHVWQALSWGVVLNDGKPPTFTTLPPVFFQQEHLMLLTLF